MGSTSALHAYTIELDTSKALQLVAAFTFLATLLPFILHIHQDYLAFLALGPGGTPPTFTGYLKVTILSFFALKNPYQPGPTPERFAGCPGNLVALPQRSGPRPCTRGIAPQRQITQKASEAVYERLAAGIEKLSNPKLVVGTSCFEKYSTGLFSVSPAKRTCKGEVCHSHPSDGSMHLTLHPADASIVLKAGWGERHPLARGGWFEQFVPAGFVMIYAPRDEKEVEVVLSIVKAAAWFVGGGDGVKEIVDDRRDSGYASAEEEKS